MAHWIPRNEPTNFKIRLLVQNTVSHLLNNVGHSLQWQWLPFKYSQIQSFCPQLQNQQCSSRRMELSASAVKCFSTGDSEFLETGLSNYWSDFQKSSVWPQIKWKCQGGWLAMIFIIIFAPRSPSANLLHQSAELCLNSS